MIGGMLLLGRIVGSYDLSVILENRELIQASPHYVPALLLILLGCFTKSAQFLFHFWLPPAMPISRTEAPTGSAFSGSVGQLVTNTPF